jgi:putative membrane protein
MSTGNDEGILLSAEFNTKVQTYWLLSGGWILTASVVGIILLPFWYVIGSFFTGRYLSHMRCVLTERTLQVTKGAFNRVEKTVPLDQITDLGLVQGPVMRFMGLEAISVETAGQSAEGALIKLIGIVDTRDFRDAVLAQRDRLLADTAGGSRPTSETTEATRPAGDVLCDIRDTLHRIEQRLSDSDGA